jgi:hypothetical protein
VADSGTETICKQAAFIWSVADLPQGGDGRWVPSC